MNSFRDQLGNTIQLSFPPKRIVSLVPSQTELLFSLGLEEDVVGITKFCIHPEKWFRTKQRVGGTKTVNIDAVKFLQPDLIIANKEENVQEQITALQEIAPVWVSDIATLDDALEMIQSVGTLVNKTGEASKMVNEITERFQQIPALNTTLRTAYLIWKDPYMAAGGDTFISDIMSYSGFDNVLKGYPRYPEITIEQLAQLDCDLILLSSEPYPFKQKHIQEIQQVLTNTKTVLVDGEMFSWYGSRLCLAPAYLTSLLNEVQQTM
ncbi:ABC transporter substrate-binding protein [Segetibacter aerophilus]|uniref:Iron ABC transporter n=1 Tax=Segetibacter aerophilus TaxID=670293 RepID=A0A512BAK8_9BACT|nr:helical backbone metal receptor [Segetibacter aerophilus]GEO08983.1 iron ABC transporter [Segetibacter aerophilus]